MILRLAMVRFRSNMSGYLGWRDLTKSSNFLVVPLVDLLEVLVFGLPGAWVAGNC